MTIEIRFYDTRAEYKQDSILMNQNGWRSLHQDSIDGKKRVTWVNGSDDPDNQPIQFRDMTEREFINYLAETHGITIRFTFRDKVRRVLGL